MTNFARINITLDDMEVLNNFYILFKNDLILASNFNTVINIPLRKFNGEEGSFFAISENAEIILNYLK